jgi:hypothetical protein
VVRPADDRDVAGAELDRRGIIGQHPRRAAHHRDNGQRLIVADAHRPRRVHHRAQQERLAGAGSIEPAGEPLLGRGVQRLLLAPFAALAPQAAA